MQVVIRQSGGLGNQLFQYAAGRLLANKYRASLRISVESPPWQYSFGHARPFLLSHFKINARFGRKTYQDRLMFTDRTDLAWVSKFARKNSNVRIIKEQPETFWSYRKFNLQNRSRLLYLIGHWQTFRIADQIESELRRELIFRVPPDGRNLETAKEISSCRNAVSIHLRRGDYLDQYGSEMIIPMDYYEAAIRRMQARYRKIRFFVFSDDPVFARNWIGGNSRFSVIDHNGATHAHEDLRLMSLCKHHIIANSTFSWWGAWLNVNRDKSVIAPSRWPGFDSREVEFLPPEWSVLEI